MEILRYGSTGAYVQMLQLALSRTGYALSTDGIFGVNTQNAVKAFQRVNSLSADGIVGPITWHALRPYLTGFTERTIARGNTYYRIAQQYGTTVRMLETANPGLDPANLPVGRRITVPLAFSVVPTNISFTSALLDYCVEGLSKRYPFLKNGSIGQSIIGQPIRYLSLGSGPRQVFFNASHHANEWITTPVLMKYVEDYCRAYAYGGIIDGTAASELFASSLLYVIPMVNPDGVDLVTGAISPGSEYYNLAASIASDYPAIPFPSGWKANIAGTDLNLNYPAGWENAKAIKFAEGYVSPAPRDYVGTAPLSAPESSAVYNFTRAHDFAITLSYHSQGEVIYWKYLDLEPENSFAIAQQFSAESGYEVAITPYESGYAGYKDWFIQDYNRPGYTIEVGRGENPLPISQFDDIYADNIGILTFALKTKL